LFLRIAICLLLISVAAAGRVDAATRYDWRLTFRSIHTPHFDIHAHQGEEALARRLAGLAEQVRESLRPMFGVPPGRVQVILVDQSDLSNGWATPFPYDTIEITAAPPGAETLIGNTDDWLRLVFTHEYTHILHLDRTRGVMRAVRGIFGRVPIAFPNAFLPVWSVEGIATYEESAATGEGRVPAGDFRVLVDQAARQHRFEPRDRAAGGLVDWPSGNAAYAYGAYFHQYLADRYGAHRVRALADAQAGRVPFFGSGAFKNVFGRGVGGLWSDFRESRQTSTARASATDTAATRITHAGFSIAAPRFAPDGSIYYARSSADGFPSLEHVSADGRAFPPLPRYLGSRTSVREGWVVFDQLQVVRSVALYSDLYAVRPGNTTVRRLTRQARASDPDLSPDGRTIACIVQVHGRGALALLGFDPDRTTTPAIVLDEEGADLGGPRWSPDGRTLVVERRVRNGDYQLVLIDATTHERRVLVARRGVRLVTPSWTNDGRTVLFAANVGNEPFNIYAASLDGNIRRVTDSVSGASAPEVSPNGRSLLYVGYTADGYDLFTIPWRPESWTTVNWGQTEPRDASAPMEQYTGELGVYQPLRTLAPTYWTPVVASDAGEQLIGAGTAMSDALGRHSYAADAAWTKGRSRPDWHIAYAYDRWWPTLFAAYSDDTDPLGGGDVRAREVLAGALFPVRRVRWSDTLLAALDVERDTFTCASACRAVLASERRTSLRGGWMHDSRRLFGYSISTEEGALIETAVETTPAALGSTADTGAAVLDLRGFHRVFSQHTVAAARVAFAGSWGDLRARRVFSASGPGPSIAAFDFGRDTIGLLRGFDPGDLIGTRAAVANVDVRFPLFRPERGLGSWPVFFRAVHGAAFVDAGHSWDEGLVLGDVRTSVGGELSLDAVLGHYAPVTFTAGAAWTRDPVADRSRFVVFGRIGRAF
jgi:Tol biopolymer transport system component